MASAVNDRYELIERLPVPEGGFARAAFKARKLGAAVSAPDAVMGHIVLLRQLPPIADTAAIEAAAAKGSSISLHPMILASDGLLRLGSDSEFDPGLYVVTEYLRGITLRERIRRVAPFSLAVTLDIALSVGQAAKKAHDHGVDHGDLRPEQVFLTPEGQVKVADFALARAVKIALGDEDDTYSDDLRAIGLLMYEMLTSVAPDHMAITDEHSAAALNANVPPAIDGIIRKATSLSPDRGYSDIGQMVTDIQTARNDLRLGRSLAWSVLEPATGRLATPAGKQPQAASPRTQPSAIPAERAVRPGTGGLLAQAAEELAVEGSKKGRRQPQAALDDDYDEPGRGSVVGKVMMATFGVLIFIFIGTIAYLFTLVQIPSDIVVPNLIGKQFDDAQRLAKTDHFALAQVGSDYMDNWPEGVIYKMTPDPGRSIKSGHEVDVYVSNGPHLVAVPDLSQMTLEKARRTLDDAGLPLGQVTYSYDNSNPKGIVTGQDPPAASMKSHQSLINLTVSKGPAPPQIPTGLTASATLQGEIDLSWSDSENATTYNVYRDGKKISEGLPETAYSDVGMGDGETHTYQVTAVNANGESDKCPPIPATTLQVAAPTNDDSGETPNDTTVTPVNPNPPPSLGADSQTPHQRMFHILFTVPQSGGRHNVQIEVQDTTGTNIVYDEDRDSGDTIDQTIPAFGNRVVFRIFIDGKLVKQQSK